jgi:hypothetical protein
MEYTVAKDQPSPLWESLERSEKMTSRQQSFRAIAARMHSLYAWIFFGTMLGLLGYFGNIFKIELFYGVDFLFGSIFSIYALLRFGFPTAVFAALLLGSTSWTSPT